MTATEERPVQILELFGGIGSPRCALRNLKIPTKAIDYVEIDEKAVRSYNNMFSEELLYKTQSVVGWNLKPDILIHGSPCQDFSIAGHQRGADEGSETRSSLMWETIHIIDQMGEWKPKYVIWENVKNVTSKHMIANFVRYQKEMERMGYTNNYDVLDAREFGLPQARERVFTISCLNGEKFDFTSLIRTPMRKISEFLEDNENVPEVYNVTQPSVYNVIGASGIKRATVIKDFAYTITTRQDRTPAQVIDCGSGRYRYLTETTGIIKLLPIEEEKRRRNLPRPGQRGVPMLDMAGYRISRTHITIRRRVFKRARRQLIRGYRELKRDGTLRRERAQKIISYNSYIEQSDSFHLQERYHTEELLQVAHRVNGFYGQLEYQKRMEELHDLLERRCRSEARKGNDGKSSGWRNDRQDGGQYQGIPSGRRKGSEDVPF